MYANTCVGKYVLRKIYSEGIFAHQHLEKASLTGCGILEMSGTDRGLSFIEPARAFALNVAIPLYYVLTLTLLTLILAQPVHAFQWTNTELQLQYGNPDIPTFAGGGSSDHFISTFQHANGWKYGDTDENAIQALLVWKFWPAAPELRIQSIFHNSCISKFQQVNNGYSHRCYRLPSQLLINSG